MLHILRCLASRLLKKRNVVCGKGHQDSRELSVAEGAKELLGDHSASHQAAVNSSCLEQG